MTIKNILFLTLLAGAMFSCSNEEALTEEVVTEEVTVIEEAPTADIEAGTEMVTDTTVVTE